MVEASDEQKPLDEADLSGGGNDIARTVIALPGGDLVVGGNFSDEVPPAAGTLDTGGEVLTSRGDFDALIMRFTPGGAVRWARAFGGPGFDLVKALALDSSGDVLAVGPIQRPGDYGCRAAAVRRRLPRLPRALRRVAARTRSVLSSIGTATARSGRPARCAPEAPRTRAPLRDRPAQTAGPDRFGPDRRGRPRDRFCAGRLGPERACLGSATD